MWWLGLCPQHHKYGSLLRARGFFITLLAPRSGSSMRKSFALCEAFGLTPFGPGAPARRGETAPFPSPWIPSARYGRLREGQGWGWRTTTAVRHAPVARP